MTNIIKTEAEIKALSIELKQKKAELTSKKEIISICVGGGCIASGSLKLKDAFDDAIKSYNLCDKAEVKGTGCLGPCVKGPVVLIGKDDIFYQNVKPEDVKDIVEQHVMGGKIVERLTWKEGKEEVPTPKMNDISFFKKQTKIVLRNCGVIDPNSIEDYIERDGYLALAKTLTSMTPDDVINQMKISGLRGRGGAGFPTWMKWSFAKKSQSDVKYILCNADEGDPGAFMDRSVLEGDPHSVIEGMAIGGYAIGATQGFVYVRAEYPLAVERLQAAIDKANEMGILGDNMFGSDFSFKLEIRMGSGAFVCGEETALMNSIEGKRGEPRPRPPYPSDAGLWGKPSVLNNVESFANIPAILLNGGEWFAQYGTEKSKGTKVFALAGAINIAGLVEVPVGTTLGELVYDIGGGIPNGKRYKSAQIGGPSGGCIPKGNLNVKLDYESLQELGAIMGSGGLIVMDEDTCMVDIARFFLEFVQEESCGKCVPCRVGTKRMLEILDKITQGAGEMEDIDKLEQLGAQICDTSLCGLGQTAPNPVLSTLRHFRHEYEAHIKEKHCEAGVCASLVRSPCQSACPAHVDVPGFVSLIAEKRFDEALMLHRERNPFAAVCARVCFHVCEEKCRRQTIDNSVAIRALKRYMVDQEVKMMIPEVKENAVNAKRKVAVIGAGPAGLSCAYFLARLGYKPVVFESEPRPGGMLIQTIPSYRLPRETLLREIRMIESMGVDIQCDMKMGRDFTLKELEEQGYESVFIGIGTSKGLDLNIKGKEARGVMTSMSFLRMYNQRGTVPVAKHVAVIGGGNAAIDTARTAIRLGAEKATIIYRRSTEEMPAFYEEIEEALSEGIELMPLTNPQEIMLDENGKVMGVKCNRMVLGNFDSSGRRKSVGEKENFVVECNQVILAIGQDLDHLKKANDVGLKTTDSSYIVIDPVNGQTSVPWIFSGGDAVQSIKSQSVIEAVAAGERAATGMDEYLTGENHAFWREDRKVDTFYDPDADPVLYPRVKLEVLDLNRRRNNFEEVEQCYSEAEAIRQAQRCLRCDYGH